MKVILPNGAMAESKNPVVIDQWKKAGYREVVPPTKPEAKPEPKLEVQPEPKPTTRKRTRKK